MKKKTWVVIAALMTGLLLVGAMGAAAVYAQSPTPPTPAAGQAGPGRPGGLGDSPRPLDQAELNAASKALGITADDLSAQLQGGKTLQEIASAQGKDINAVWQAMRAARPMRLGTTELDAAARTLGMTANDLSTQLKSGKTLSDLATEKGVTLQVVQDAIKAAHQTEFTTQINQAVTDGKMTQDKANWLLEGLNKGYLDEPGVFGLGFGAGPAGPHMGRGQQPGLAAPTTAP